MTVVEEVTPKKRKRGEPAKWAKIQLPSNTPVWVFAPYIETTNHTVNTKRLNLRAGPGEKYSVIGRIDRGTPVKEIRTDGQWMEIEAPAKAYAFVAAQFLDVNAAPATPEIAVNATTNTVPAEPLPAVETVKPESKPAVAVETPQARKKYASRSSCRAASRRRPPMPWRASRATGPSTISTARAKTSTSGNSPAKK